MEDSIRVHFAKVLTASGIDWKAASLKAKWPNGKRLGPTYARDTIKRGRGKWEGVAAVCDYNGLNWDDPAKTDTRGNGAAPPASPTLETPASGAREAALGSLLAERRRLLERLPELNAQIADITELLHG